MHISNRFVTVCNIQIGSRLQTALFFFFYLNFQPPPGLLRPLPPAYLILPNVPTLPPAY